MVITQALWEILHGVLPDPTGILNMGMNLPGQVYYDPSTIYNDPMKATTKWRTYALEGDGQPTDMLDEIPVDVNGYALDLPITTSDGNSTALQIFLNNYNVGRYRMEYDGVGSLSGSIEEDENGYYIDLTGTGSVKYLNIKETSSDDYIRNIRFYKDTYNSYEEQPKFNETFMRGLEGFGAIRFMDLGNTNESQLSDTRVTQTYHTQSEANKGMSYEDMCEISNQLQADAWVCVPACATNAYITEMAQVFYDNLDPNLKVYVEYSNEIWNWIFSQANWVANGGEYDGGEYKDALPSATDADVITEFARLRDETSADFPEMGAYMMARTFYYWDAVFSDQRSRLVTVAAGQSAWPDNNKRILYYLWDESTYAPNSKYGAIGCDAYAVGAYFNGITEEVSDSWEVLGDALTFEDIYQVGYANALKAYGDAQENKGYMDYINNKYVASVKYIVYEGGQHMQPYNQEEYTYNQKLYDFQINSLMYDLYQYHFNNLAKDDVDCDLFMAFSYMGPREQKYGSW